MRRHEIQYFLKDPAGQFYPPAGILSNVGARLPVVVGLPPQFEQAYKKAGLSIPEPQTATAVVDTGCTRTSVDKTIVTALGLLPTGSGTTCTAGGPAPTLLYAVSLFFPQLNAGIVIPQAMDCDLTGMGGLGVLLGCDLLKHFVMIYDGIAGRVTLIN